MKEKEERVLMSGFLIFHRCPSKDRLSEYLNKTALEILPIREKLPLVDPQLLSKIEAVGAKFRRGLSKISLNLYTLPFGRHGASFRLLPPNKVQELEELKAAIREEYAKLSVEVNRAIESRFTDVALTYLKEELEASEDSIHSRIADKLDVKLEEIFDVQLVPLAISASTWREFMNEYMKSQLKRANELAERERQRKIEHQKFLQEQIANLNREKEEVRAKLKELYGVDDLEAIKQRLRAEADQLDEALKEKREEALEASLYYKAVAKGELEKIQSEIEERERTLQTLATDLMDLERMRIATQRQLQDLRSRMESTQNRERLRLLRGLEESCQSDFKNLVNRMREALRFKAKGRGPASASLEREVKGKLEVLRGTFSTPSEVESLLEAALATCKYLRNAADPFLRREAELAHKNLWPRWQGEHRQLKTLLSSIGDTKRKKREVVG